MFELIYDLFCIIIFYICVYKVINLITTKYALECREMFGIGFSTQALSRENDTRNNHEIFSNISSTITIIILSISPIISSCIFLLFYKAIDVRQLNKVLLMIVLSKLVKIHHSDFRPLNKIDQAFLVFQILFIIGNYTSRDVLFQTAFQLFDEILNIENALTVLKQALSRILIDVESSAGKRISEAIITLKSWNNIIKLLHKVLLVIVLILSLIVLKGFEISNISFYYYAIYRLTNIF